MIAAEQSAIVAETGNYGGETIAPVAPAPKVKRKKTVSIKSINNAATWQLENEEDVKKYIVELEKKLMNNFGRRYDYQHRILGESKMNKTAIRKFAEWAREKLIEDIKYKASMVGITENGIAGKITAVNK